MARFMNSPAKSRTRFTPVLISHRECVPGVGIDMPAGPALPTGGRNRVSRASFVICAASNFMCAPSLR